MVCTEGQAAVLKSEGLSLCPLKTRYNHQDYGDYIRRVGTKLAFVNKFDGVGYLDSDNFWDDYYWASIQKVKKKTRKNIIISSRKLLLEDGRLVDAPAQEFFDTNTINLFGDFKKIGSLWGCYPREMSLIGDRIVSQYIQTHFPDEIAYADEARVIYRYAKISTKKVDEFKFWYSQHYHSIAESFRNRFGFDVQIQI